MRQIIARDMKKEGWQCKCIRCREVRENYDPKEKLYLFRQDYKASGGREIFLSYKNKNQTKLYSLLRLRIPNWSEKRSRSVFPVLKNAAVIREVHTYGQQLPLPNRESLLISPQHKGLGKKSIKEAEKIAKKEFDNWHGHICIPQAKGERALFAYNKIAVISGVGVRSYFKKLGYRLKNTYTIRRI